MLKQRLPGCYGFVATFDEQSDHCGACPLQKHCKEEAAKRLASMSAEVDVTLLTKRFAGSTAIEKAMIKKGPQRRITRRERIKRYTQTSEEVLLAMHLPARERKIVQVIHRKGIPVKQMIQAGANPFENQRPGFLYIASRLLIEQGDFSRQQLKAALMSGIDDLADATAESYATIALRVMAALQVVKKNGDLYSRVNNR